MNNYSFDTSYEPYLENKAFNKRTQCDEVMAFIKKGANNLLQIAQGMKIPQAVISARVNDLIDEGRAKYEGFTIYANRKRKKIVAVVKKELTQPELFN